MLKIGSLHRHPMYHSQAYYGEGYGNITIDDLNCSGYETSIVNCASSPWLTHNCGHNEDVGVDCYRMLLGLHKLVNINIKVLFYCNI